MTTIDDFNALVQSNGNPVIYHRDESTTPCPCRTPEGFRDPIWHLQHPSEPVCNEAGMLPGVPVHISVKGFIQPVQAAAVRRMDDETLLRLFNQVQEDDHIGMFPVNWSGNRLNFWSWGRAAEDYVEYQGRRFTVVNANMIPAPEGDPEHHWECGLRLISGDS